MRLKTKSAMNIQTTTHIEAIQQLPPGGTLILTDVPWEDYEQLLDELGESTPFRITYDQGRMDIMGPSHKHELFKEVVSRMAFVMAEEMSLTVENLGSATHKQPWLSRGVEPDVCFYVQNAPLIIGTLDLDLRTDPPPDVVVEIDVYHCSKSKFPIYAGMKVPELWRFDEADAHIYELQGDYYVEISSSVAFPPLTSDVLTRFLEQSKSQGQTETVKSFREWLRGELAK